MIFLDAAAAAVPAAAALTRSSIDSSRTVLVNPEDAQEGRHEPEQGGEEGEGDVGLELAALVARDGVDVVPVEDVAARVAEHLYAYCQSLSASPWKLDMRRRKGCVSCYLH